MEVLIALVKILFGTAQLLWIIFNGPRELLNNILLDVLEIEMVKIGYFICESSTESKRLIKIWDWILPLPVLSYLYYKFIGIPVFIKKANLVNERYNLFFKKIVLVPAEDVGKFDVQYQRRPLAEIYLETKKGFVDTKYTQKEFLKMFQSKIIAAGIKYKL